MDQILINKFVCEPHLINQFIRGELFVLIDCILSNNSMPSSEQLTFVIDFLQLFINFAVKYFQNLPMFLQEVMIKLILCKIYNYYRKILP